MFGRGAGCELTRAAVSVMREAGYGEATLWVLTGNHRAIGFYEAGGRRPDGVEKETGLAAATVTEQRYRLPLLG